MKKDLGLRITLIFLAVIVGLLILLLLVGFISGKLYFERDKDGKISLVVDAANGVKCTYESVIDAMNTTHPTKLFVLGADCNFPETVPYKNINSLKDSEIVSEKKFKVIIVNDMDGKVELTEDDYEFLYSKVFDGEYSFIYIGKSKLKNFVEKNFIHDNFYETDAGFCIRKHGEDAIKSIGFWTDEVQGYYDGESKHILSEVIITGTIYDIIRGE